MFFRVVWEDGDQDLQGQKAPKMLWSSGVSSILCSFAGRVTYLASRSQQSEKHRQENSVYETADVLNGDRNPQIIKIGQKIGQK